MIKEKNFRKFHFPEKFFSGVWEKWKVKNFSEKEFRLYELDYIIEMVDSINGLSIESTERFQFNRKATLEGLVDKVKGRHYSTFSLYKEDELDQALKEFQKNIRRQFQDTNRIEWLDENILFILRVQ